MRVLLADRAILNGYALGLADGLRASGVEARVGGPARSGDPDSIPLYPRVGVPGERIGKARDALVGLLRFQRLLVSTRPDVLHIQWPTGLDAAYGAWAKRAFGIRLVYTAHNPTGRTNQPEPHAATQRRLIALADVVLTHGPLLRDAVVRVHPNAEHKTFVVEHGNYEHMIVQRHTRREARAILEIDSDDPLFTFVGQLSPRKGLDLLLEAFIEYRRRGHRGTLLIAGTTTDPSYARKLHGIAARCRSSIRWIVSDRAISQAALDLAIAAASQVVLPFPDASQSGSLILAMTHGRCVVSTIVGEIPRTLGNRGVLFPAGDREQLIQALVLAEHNPQLCDELGARAREYALRELSWQTIGARTLRLYEGAKIP